MEPNFILIQGQYINLHYVVALDRGTVTGTAPSLRVHGLSHPLLLTEDEFQRAEEAIWSFRLGADLSAGS